MITLENEVRYAGLSPKTYVGVDDIIGNILKESITVEQLLTGRTKKLRNRKVVQVINGCDQPNAYIFVVK